MFFSCFVFTLAWEWKIYFCDPAWEIKSFQWYFLPCSVWFPFRLMLLKREKNPILKMFSVFRPSVWNLFDGVRNAREIYRSRQSSSGYFESHVALEFAPAYNFSSPLLFHHEWICWQIAIFPAQIIRPSGDLLVVLHLLGRRIDSNYLYRVSMLKLSHMALFVFVTLQSQTFPRRTDHDILSINWLQWFLLFSLRFEDKLSENIEMQSGENWTLGKSFLLWKFRIQFNFILMFLSEICLPSLNF